MLADPIPRASIGLPRWAVWLGFVVLCNATGYLSSLAGREAPIYRSLEQPSWAPPSWVFAPVWTALYTLMGTATYFVWRDTSGVSRRAAMTIFAVQLALNAAWSPVFFGLHEYGLAVIVIAGVLAASTAMMIIYARRVRLAGALIAPLVVWVSFASALNIAIWSLNR